MSASSWVKRLVIDIRRSPSFDMARDFEEEPFGVGIPKPFLEDGDSTMFLESMLERSGFEPRFETL